ASNPGSSASPALRQYKDALVPRRFSNNSLPPFCPLTLHLPAPPHPVVPQAALSSTYSLRPPPTSSQPHRYDPASGNHGAARPAGSYSLDASAALPRPSDPCVDPCTMALVKRPAFQQVAGDLVTRRP